MSKTIRSRVILNVSGTSFLDRAYGVRHGRGITLVDVLFAAY